MQTKIAVELNDDGLVQRLLGGSRCAEGSERRLAPGVVVRYVGSTQAQTLGLPDLLEFEAEVEHLSLVPILSSWLHSALHESVTWLGIGETIVLMIEEDIALALLASLAGPISVTA